MNRRPYAGALVAAFLLSACQGGTVNSLPSSSQSSKTPRAKPQSIYSSACNPAPGAVAGTITEYPIPWTGTAAGPFNLAVDANNNVWFTAYGRSSIGQLAPNVSPDVRRAQARPNAVLGEWNEYPTPTKNSEPWGITIGPDGNPWFSEYLGSKAGRLTLGSHTITEFAAQGYGMAITTGPDGYIWMNENQGSTARISTTGAQVTSTSGGQYGISGDSSGKLYVPQRNGDQANEIVVPINPLNWSLGSHAYRIPTASSGPWGITEGPTGTGMWFAEQSANKIGNLKPNLTFAEYAVPTASGGPTEVVAACGNIWFTEDAANKIGELTPSGHFTEYPVPTAGSEPLGITADANGNVWFTEYLGNKIGEINTANGAPAGPELSVFNSAPVGGVNNQITNFGPGTLSTATSEITNLPGATWDGYGKMTYDRAGDLWVGANGVITEYGPGATGNATPLAAISPTNAIKQVDGIAVDASGNVYVYDDADAAVYVYAAGSNGSVSPIRTISGSSTGLGAASTGLALDSSGNIWVASGVGVSEFAAGANGNVAPIDTINTAATFAACGMNAEYNQSNVTGIAFDRSGNLLLGMNIVGIPDVFEYAPGSTATTCPTASAGAGAGGPPYDIAVDAQNFVYILVNGFPVYQYTESQLFGSGVTATVSDMTQISDPVAIAAYNGSSGDLARRSAKGKKAETH